MQLIKQILNNHSDTFIEELEMIGFTTSMAKKILAEISANMDIDPDTLDIPQTVKTLISKNPARLIQMIDIQPLCFKFVLDEYKVRLALNHIEPILSCYLLQRKDHIVDTISSLAWGSHGQPLNVLKSIF